MQLLLLLVAAVAVLAVVGRLGHRYLFPYGYTHACSKYLAISFRLYANDHGGWFPHGESSPEASLGLLAKHDPTTVYLLGGKHIPSSVAAQAFTNGTFGPEMCGWHYVEGLHVDDDPDVAVAWDKVTGLGHNGERRRGFMHEVVFLGGYTEFITKSAWTEFVNKQKEKLERVIASRCTNDPPIQWSDEATLGPNRFAPQTVIGHHPSTTAQ